MLRDQPLSPLALPRTLVSRLLSLTSHTLLIRLAFQLLHDSATGALVCGDGDISLNVIQWIVQRVCSSSLAARNLDLVIFVDHAQDLAGLGVSLDLDFANVKLRGGFGAAVDLERV